MIYCSFSVTYTKSDYADMANRDPKDGATGITVGIVRAILSNWITHFLNIKGPR
jgi:hypothetical protein